MAMQRGCAATRAFASLNTEEERIQLAPLLLGWWPPPLVPVKPLALGLTDPPLVPARDKETSKQPAEKRKRILDETTAFAAADAGFATPRLLTGYAADQTRSDGYPDAPAEMRNLLKDDGVAVRLFDLLQDAPYPFRLPTADHVSCHILGAARDLFLGKDQATVQTLTLDAGTTRTEGQDANLPEGHAILTIDTTGSTAMAAVKPEEPKEQ